MNLEIEAYKGELRLLREAKQSGYGANSLRAIGALKEQVRTLRERLANVHVLLEVIAVSRNDACPICHIVKNPWAPHAPDCRLSLLIEATKPQ